MKKILYFVLGISIFSVPVSGQTPVYQWAYAFGGNFASGSDENASAIETDASGNVYISGNYTNTFDADPGVGISNVTSACAGCNSMIITKYDANGNFVWAKGITTPTGGVEPRELEI